MKKEKLVIIGSGPAGFCAAIYAARANLSPLIYEGFMTGPGGQLMTTTDVENYPGFAKGITGPELMQELKDQAVRFGARILTEDVKEVSFSKRPFTIHGSKTSVLSESVIIATGASAKRLDIEGARDHEFWQKGVTACAVCDGAAPLFRNKPLYVIGGGDSAVEEAIFLTKFGSRVFLVHRRDQLRASKIMAERAMKHPKIEILWNQEIVKIGGDTVVRRVWIKNFVTGAIEEKEAAGVFFAIGHQPNTSFLQGALKLNDAGYILVSNGMRTSVEGVFACGDVQDWIYRQAITAAGTGCMAALDAEKWLSDQGIE